MLDSILESSLVIDLYYSLYDFTWKFNIFFIYNLFIFFIGSVWFLQIVYFFSFYLSVLSISILSKRIYVKREKPPYCFPKNNTAAFLFIFLRLFAQNLSFWRGHVGIEPTQDALNAQH